MLKEITVKFHINDEQMDRLEKIRQKWMVIPGRDDDYPFRNYTIEKMFQTVMEIGSMHTINRHLSAMEEFYLSEKTETPAGGAARESR